MWSPSYPHPSWLQSMVMQLRRGRVIPSCSVISGKGNASTSTRYPQRGIQVAAQASPKYGFNTAVGRTFESRRPPEWLMFFAGLRSPKRQRHWVS